jgi:hypothetical protein
MGACSVEERPTMLRKRNLIALLMAAMLSLGTIGVAFAEDSGSDRLGGEPGTSTYVDREAAH